MCLITEQKTPLIAEKDMVVYKVMETNLCSFFQYFPYEIDKLFETEIKHNDETIWTACCSLDSDYLMQKYKVDCVRDLKGHPKLICLKYGFSSCKSIKVASEINHGYRGTIYRCIIPKGSEYYKDKVGFIISNKIIIKKIAQQKIK